MYVIGTTYLDKCFLFHVITGRLLFLVKVCCYSVVLVNHYLHHDLVLSLKKNVFKELRILLYLEIKSAMLKQKFQKKGFLKNLRFFTLSFSESSTFFFKNEIHNSKSL